MRTRVCPKKDTWAELPKEIVDTFDKLGIPKAEREYLGGVGAQYDSGVVYHHLKKTLSDKGVILKIWMSLCKNIQNWCENIS